MNDSFGAGGFDTTIGQGSGVPAESKPEGIVPMVIQQIHDCPESGLCLYDMVFGSVNFVAIVRAVDHSSTKITYKLEDHTGQIDGYIWLEEGGADKAPHIVVNTYAKISGSVRNQNGVKALIIFKIESVTNPNELTTHLLEVINARLSAEEYAVKKKSEVNGDFRMEVPVAARVATTTTNGGAPPHPLGLSGKELTVYTAISKDISEQGISFQELERKFTHISNSEMRKITDFMTEEGMIYTSTDSDHFKCSEGGD